MSSNWEEIRFDKIATLIRGNSSFKKDELLKKGNYVALQYGKTYNVNEINDNFNFYVNEDFYKNNQVVNYGDTILISTSETIEDLGHSVFYNRKDIGLIGGEQILLKPNKNSMDSKYLTHLTKTISNKLKELSKGMKVYRFKIDDLKQLIVNIPVNIKEQKSIATFLDKKTSLIDKKLSILQERKKLILELEKSVINQVVTRGLQSFNLDKNGKKIDFNNDKGLIDSEFEIYMGECGYKDSGIEWIGYIPKSKNTIRTNKKMSFESVKVNDTDYTPLSVTYGGVVPRLENAAKSDAHDDRKRILKNQFVINNRADRRGACGISEYTGSCSKVYSVFNIINGFPNYYHHLFRSRKFSDEFYFQGKGIVEDLWTTSPDKFLKINIPNFSKKEEEKISSFINLKISQFKKQVSNIDKEIELLKEFRKTVINDVVTGKIKVVV